MSKLQWLLGSSNVLWAQVIGMNSCQFPEGTVNLPAVTTVQGRGLWNSLSLLQLDHGRSHSQFMTHNINQIQLDNAVTTAYIITMLYAWFWYWQKFSIYATTAFVAYVKFWHSQIWRISMIFHKISAGVNSNLWDWFLDDSWMLQ